MCYSVVRMSTKLFSPKRYIKEFSAALIVYFLIFSSITSVLGAGDIAKAYCHKNSGASEFVYLFNKAWDSHFDNNGTPLSGHELDKMTVEGDTDCDGNVDITTSPTLTPSPEPSITVSVTPAVTISVSPIVTPTTELTPTPIDPTATPNPTATPIPGSNSNDSSSSSGGTSDGGQVLGTSTTRGQVLGASTMASTGTAENILIMLGVLLIATSTYGIKYAFSKKI